MKLYNDFVKIFLGRVTIKGTKNFWADENLGGTIRGGGTIEGFTVFMF